MLFIYLFPKAFRTNWVQLTDVTMRQAKKQVAKFIQMLEGICWDEIFYIFLNCNLDF